MTCDSSSKKEAMEVVCLHGYGAMVKNSGEQIRCAPDLSGRRTRGEGSLPLKLIGRNPNIRFIKKKKKWDGMIMKNEQENPVIKVL